MTVSQRWRDRRDSYRPAGEPIRTADYEVVEVAGDAGVKAFVARHHYSGSFPAARFRFELRRHAELVGVAIFSHPCSNAVLTRVFPGAALESTELGRLVLLDDVPANGESWMVARCFEVLARHGIIGILSHSDPIARARADGTIVKPGHVGTIYQALNGVFLGRTQARAMFLLPDGRVMSVRSLMKIHARHRGWRYAAAQLIEHGATPLTETEDARTWTAEWLPRLTRRVRHTGNFRYAWGLNRATKRTLHAIGPYPKLLETAA